MLMTDPNLQQAPATPSKKYIPWITAACCLICIGLFIGINLDSNDGSWEFFRKWGYPSIEHIWNGDYWGLITSNFLHVQIIHIAFNLYWFWFFGRKMEYTTSKAFYALFLLSAGAISSLGQLIASDATGYGLSGVVYAQLGYIFYKSRTDEEYKGFINQKTINWFIIWLLLCLLLTRFGIMDIGNAAHITGFLWGLLVAYLERYKGVIRLSVPLSILVLTAIPAFYQPWSTLWLENKAYNLIKEEKLDEGETLCRTILAREDDNEFARANLKVIRIKRLYRDAYKAHEEERYADASKLYQQILQLEPENAWAKENMSRLPVTFMLKK